MRTSVMVDKIRIVCAAFVTTLSARSFKTNRSRGTVIVWIAPGVDLSYKMSCLRQSSISSRPQRQQQIGDPHTSAQETFVSSQTSCSLRKFAPPLLHLHVPTRVLVKGYLHHCEKRVSELGQVSLNFAENEILIDFSGYISTLDDFKNIIIIDGANLRL